MPKRARIRGEKSLARRSKPRVKELRRASSEDLVDEDDKTRAGIQSRSMENRIAIVAIVWMMSMRNMRIVGNGDADMDVPVSWLASEAWKLPAKSHISQQRQPAMIEAFLTFNAVMNGVSLIVD